MPKPALQTLEDMNESLRVMGKFMTDLNFDALTVSEAAKLYEFGSALERVGAAARMMVMPVVDRAASRR
jgi:hypothetical protein